jgi:hypothetical protein
MYFLLVSCLTYHSTLQLKAVLSYETSNGFHRHARHYNSEGYRCENFNFKKCMWHGEMNRKNYKITIITSFNFRCAFLGLVSVYLVPVSKKFLNDEPKLTNFSPLNYRGIASLLKYI